MILYWIEVVFLGYFFYITIYNLIFSIAGCLYKCPAYVNRNKFRRFCLLIPAYKEDGVIVDVARNALKQDYPSDLYEVVVIADSLLPKTMEELKALPITVVEVSFEKSTKVKALNQAFSQLGDAFDHAVVIDADNILAPDFLSIVNNIHHSGIKAIQGRRAAKNKDNALSLLDGLSEEINNHFLGKGSTALGLSSSLKGSGMSFDYSLVKNELANMHSIGGFDRELELRILSKGFKVKYIHDAVVYDEKVEKDEVFRNQRTRWFASQFIYLRKYFFEGIKSLFRGRLAYFNSSILRNIQLPRLVNFGLFTLITALFTLISIWEPTHYKYWLILFGVITISNMIAIPKEYLNRDLLKAIFKIPGIFITLLLILFRLKGADKRFIHTPHGKKED